MPELILVHDPRRIVASDAIAHARALACSSVAHGLSPWMTAAGLAYGADGYLGVAVCSVHNARHEVLASFTDRNLTAANLAAVRDHDAEPIPPDPEVQRRLAIVAATTLEDLKAALVADYGVVL